MAKSLSLADVFDVLLKQKLGFKFGVPERVDKDSLSVVLPILRKTSLKRQYSTFPETDKVMVFDTGKIDEMEVQNPTAENIFIRSGTIFRGATQERALQRSAVVFPGQKIKLNVRCIHASRPIGGGSKVTYGGLTPLNMDAATYGEGFKPKGQGEYWDSVLSNTTQMNKLSGKSPEMNTGAASLHRQHNALRGDNYWANQIMYSSSAGQLHESPPDMAGLIGAVAGHAHSGPDKVDDLASNLDSFAKNFEHILSKVKLVENQAGLALITDRGVETIEIFDHADSWKALHESAVKRLGQNLVGKDKENVFDYKPEVAVRKTMEVLGLDWKKNLIYEHMPNNGEPHLLITGLSCQDYVGEVVEVNEHVVHLVVLKKAA